MNQGSKLYVGNFPYSTTENSLAELFEDYGDVQSVRIVVDDNEVSKGYGFVEMRTPAAAENAMRKLQDTMFNGRRLRVGYATPKGVNGKK